jgi:phosphoglucomutase
MEKADPKVLERAQRWLADDYDQETKLRVREMMDNDPVALTDAFYRDLEFGTGGLRGLMGVGTNRMNKYTVGMATQGLANYLLECFPEEEQPSVAIAYDSRNNSPFFADVAAEIMSANGIKVFLFDKLRPIPLLSYAVRHFGCQAGIVVTASHNPREYNGYKVFWGDGGQVVPPHDKNIIREVQKIKQLDQIRFGRVEELIEVLDEAFDRLYIDTLKTYSLLPAETGSRKTLKIVFSPIHGTGVFLAPKALKAFGFQQVFNVPEQDVVSGDFPTVKSPNPEEAAAMKMALDRGSQVGADLVMATDPDGDRVGVAVQGPKGDYVLLNGNQTAAVMIYYILEQWKARKRFTGKEYLVKTIVTTEVLAEMARHYGVDCYDVLTGFKYIGELIGKLEGEKTFIAGGEESYGYLVGDYIRDKDAIISCCIMAEATAWAMEQGKSVFDLLAEIYSRFGFYYEKLLSVTRKGKAGLEEIQALMAHYREKTPETIRQTRVVRVHDYASGKTRDMVSGEVSPLDFPASNVLQFILEDGTLITMRPSGTEPKIKFYVGVRATLKHASEYMSVREQLDRLADEYLHALKPA